MTNINKTFLLLGGNVGDVKSTFSKSRNLIQERIGAIEKSSAIYSSQAWGKEDQPDFLNQVLLVQTKLEPLNLLKVILDIEIELGRVRFETWGERAIDIDILFYNDLVLESSELMIPHPYLHERMFTLVPLAEISNGLLHPVLKKSIEELLLSCPDSLKVKPIEKYFVN